MYCLLHLSMSGIWSLWFGSGFLRRLQSSKGCRIYYCRSHHGAATPLLFIFTSRLAVPIDFPITTSTLQLHPSKYPDQGHWSQPWFSHSCTPHIQLISKSCWFYLNSVSRIQHADNLKIPGLGASLLLLYSAQQSE